MRGVPAQGNEIRASADNSEAVGRRSIAGDLVGGVCVCMDHTRAKTKCQEIEDE